MMNPAALRGALQSEISDVTIKDNTFVRNNRTVRSYTR